VSTKAGVLHRGADAAKGWQLSGGAHAQQREHFQSAGAPLEVAGPGVTDGHQPMSRMIVAGRLGPDAVFRVGRLTTVRTPRSPARAVEIHSLLVQCLQHPAAALGAGLVGRVLLITGRAPASRLRPSHAALSIGSFSGWHTICSATQRSGTVIVGSTGMLRASPASTDVWSVS
jgi:hypothetical protein